MRFHEILMHIFEKIRGKLTMFPKKGEIFFFSLQKEPKRFGSLNFLTFIVLRTTYEGTLDVGKIFHHTLMPSKKGLLIYIA